MLTPIDLRHLAIFRLTLPSCLTIWDGSKIVLTGRRIGLNFVWQNLKAGKSPNEIRDDYSLDQQLLTDVIQFCREYPTEVDEYCREYEVAGDRVWEEYKRSPYYKPGPTRQELLRRRAEIGLAPPPDLGVEFDQPL